MVPIFTVLVCYAVDFGFFFLVATSLNSAARNAMEYSIQGTSSPAQAAEPTAASFPILPSPASGFPAPPPPPSLFGYVLARWA